MNTLVPTWWVEFAKRRPTLRHPLVRSDYDKIEVSAMSRDQAANAFYQRFPPSHKIVAIYPASQTGMA